MIGANEEEFSYIQKHEVRKVVYEELNDYGHTPLKRVVKELAANTMDIKPDICGINIVHLKRDIEDCIKRVIVLEDEVRLNIAQLSAMQHQLNQLIEMDKGNILGKLVVLKDES